MIALFLTLRLDIRLMKIKGKICLTKCLVTWKMRLVFSSGSRIHSEGSLRGRVPTVVSAMQEPRKVSAMSHTTVSKSNIIWTCELQFFMILKMAHIGSFSEGCTYSYKNIVKASFSIMAISVLNLSLSVSDFYQFSAHPKPEGRGGTWSREWVGSRNRDREMAWWSQNWVEVFRSVPGLYGKVLTGFLSVSFGWKRKF